MDYGLAQLSVRTDQKEGSLQESRTSTAAGTSTENQLLFIQSYYTFEMRSNYAGMKLPSTFPHPTSKQIISSR